MKLTRKQKRYLIAKAIEFTVHGLPFMGMFFVVGSLGALELRNIGYVQFLLQCIIGIAMFPFSQYAHYKIYEEERDDYEFR